MVYYSAATTRPADLWGKYLSNNSKLKNIIQLFKISNRNKRNLNTNISLRWIVDKNIPDTQRVNVSSMIVRFFLCKKRLLLWRTIIMNRLIPILILEMRKKLWCHLFCVVRTELRSFIYTIFSVLEFKLNILTTINTCERSRWWIWMKFGIQIDYIIV